MRILFLGSDSIACPALQILNDHSDFEIVGVVCQPDRPSGRRRKLASCAIRILAEDLGFPVFTPNQVSTPESVEALQALHPDLTVVAAYGQYLKRPILELAPMGIINLHPSLLPKYRGASPIQWPIVNGDAVSGVTILHVSKELDGGDMILQEEVNILEDDTAATLGDRLAELGGHLLVKAIQEIVSGEALRIPQDNDQATYVGKLSKEDGQLSWDSTAEELYNQIRGFTPWPGTYCTFPVGSDKSLRIHTAKVCEGTGVPGLILQADRAGLIVATGAEALQLLEVQPAGGKRMRAVDFMNGHKIRIGDRLG